MWEFLGSVLEQHGLAAVVILATYAGLGLAIRELWKRLHTERDAASAREKQHAEALEKLVAAAAARETGLLRDEHEKRSQMRAEHERELAKLQAAVLADAKEFAGRLHQLQDRRNDELREILRESLEHMGETRASVEKITEAMSTLREVVRR